ncbi:uncharacterized protein LOC122881574 isoform X1 [Siniperca chuatsi]|uniref:uncharacterized protein LOC122881574 isoform X1 n=1 Tax=Siniperca chuatsi TaxID=119488 RepID=UPI001CE0F9FF|nr:uncharacterized protein LOC122881574 isoform X1 [Siniperca chuatsi]XP_044063848.1 uncharacterized protein LOC122881574 isoform X1 [Siniperca chuatsi]
MPLSRKCIFPGCENLQNNSVSLFKFPKNDEIKKKWIDFVKSHLDGELRITTNTRLCSEHFTPGSFTNFHRRQLGFTDNPLLLVNGAEPTISRPGLHPPVPPTTGAIVGSLCPPISGTGGSASRILPAVRHVASQTDPPERKSVSTQLSMKTLQNHFRSTATQARVPSRDCGVCTLTFPLDSPLLFLQPTIVKRPSKRPRLSITDEKEGPAECSLSMVVHEPEDST